MKYIRYILLFTIGSFLFIGCAFNEVSLDSNTRNELRGKTITVIHKKGPVRPWESRGGGISIESTIINAIGSEVTARQSDGPNYGNPTEVLNKRVISYLVRKYSLRYRNNSFPPETTSTGAFSFNKGTPSLNYATIKKYNTDYVLDINSYWSTMVTFPRRIILTLNNDIRLIDTKKQKIIAQISCEDQSTSTTTKQGKKYYTDESLYAHNGALLKQVASKTINKCMDQIRQKIFR